MRIALYGLPCAGKTTILSSLKNVRVVNGSQELNKMSGGTFNTLAEEEKNNYRIKYIEFLMSLTDDLILSDGHYSFLENVVFTEQDAQAYDVFIYLFCSAETLLSRYACSDKNKKYAELSIARIEQWQNFEIEHLRYECHRNNKDFYAVNGEDLTAEDFAMFLEKINGGYSSYSIAEAIVKRIIEAYPNPCTMCLVDGDKTLIVQDSFRVCSKGCKTTIFDGNFYTGYQSLMFAEEEKKIEYDYEFLDTIEINHQVYDIIKNNPYFVISAGITELLTRLARIHNFKNVIASPLISADTKYYIVKLLQNKGYVIKAYGDSKNDLYMLQAANEGYLCTAERLSRSHVGANMSNLRLIYDKSLVVLNESYATETCLFYDGKAHKIGAVDVEKFPKGRFMEPWKFISEDGRFNMTMQPTLDNHSDVDFKVGRMNCHQIYGIWNGDVTLDDGTKIEIKDLFAFCEYVENRW